MNGFRLPLLFSLMLISPSAHSLDKCICVKTDSDIVIDCTNLGIVTFPLDITSSELELHRAEFTAIDLSQNELIQADFPSGYKRVVRINLAYNEIATMKNVTVSDVESLKELDLSHNKRLEKLTIELKSKSLEILTIRDCSISEVEEGFLESFPSLKLMDLSHNSLSEMGLFSPFDPKDLESGEDFPSRSNDGKQFQLTHLNVSHNQLVKVHGKSFRFAKIKVLDVSNNRISHLKFTIYLPHLEELYAAGNHLKNLDGLSAPNLVRLDVSGNKLKDVSFDFNVKTPRLKILSIGKNHLEKLTKIKSKSVVELDVSYSRVRVVEPNAFSGLERLERLDLIGNELSGLRRELFSDARHLKFLFLGGNPWNCDCSSEEFRDFHDLVLFERRYSNGEDLHCRGDSNKTWSAACGGDPHKDDLVLSERGALYTLLYIFAALLTLIVVASCFKCIRNMRQRADFTFDNGNAVLNDDNFEYLQTPLPVDRSTVDDSFSPDRPPSFPERRSTPPPNYEAALMLPALTEEQRITAISTLSLHRIPQ